MSPPPTNRTTTQWLTGSETGGETGSETSHVVKLSLPGILVIVVGATVKALCPADLL